MKLDFVTVDVFTDRQFGGNPLAVVLNGEGVATGQMQSIAAEFNLAETAFVLPAKAASSTAEVRIFTPRAELPFAGHPNIGTAFVLATVGMKDGRAVGDHIVFEEKAGLVGLDIIRDGGSIVGARLAAPQGLACDDEIPTDIVASGCSIDARDIDTSRHRPRIVSCGIPLVFAELKTRAALAGARPRTDVFAQHIPMQRATGIHLYTRDDTRGFDIQARMFAPLYGVPEDPATGSANAALVGFLASLRSETDLTLTLRIAQGVDMGRPSLLEATAEKRHGQVTGIWIAGRCVPMMRGSLEI